MPSKREARNNFFSDPQYAFLGLHQAAHSGNVGLVEYALSEGQPVDALWDGISPLHAAAAGGSEHVVRLLIEKGADVNLGRLYIKDREMKLRAVSSSSSLIPSPDSSMPLDRSEALLNTGSTPLHYACAHNNAAAARLLLAAGAAPHIPDKRGVTPLDLLPPASQGSSSSPPTDTLRVVIREYYENEKAKEKEFNKSQSSQTLRSQSKAGSLLGLQRSDDDNTANFTSSIAPHSSSNGTPIPIPSTPSSSSRAGAKRSLENLLSMGLSASPRHIPPPLSPNGGSSLTSRKSPPPSPAKFTFGNAVQNVVPNHPSSSGHISSSPPPQYPYTERRPSLPQVFSSSPGPNLSRPPMPTHHSSSTTTSTFDPFRPRSSDGEQDGRKATLPLPPNSAHAHSASIQGYTPPNPSSFDSPRHLHGHHAHTHSATLPTAVATASSSPAASRPPRTKRSLLSLFGKNREEKEDREKDRGRQKEKDKEKERERSFSRPSFSTLSRPSFSAFGSGNGGGQTPIPLPSRPSPLPIPTPNNRARHTPSPIVVAPPTEKTHEVSTAPPERTTFDIIPRSSRLKNADEDEDEDEEYGVELRRRGGVYDYTEGDDAAGSEEEEESEWDGEEDEEEASSSEGESEEEGEEEGEEEEVVTDPQTNSHKPAHLAIEASKRATDNSVSGSRVASVNSSKPEIAGPQQVSPPTTTATPSPHPPLPSSFSTTSSPSRPPILRDPSNGNRQKNHRGNGSDPTGALRRSGSLRFELEGEHPNNNNNTHHPETGTNAVRGDHKPGSGMGMPDRERKISVEGVAGRRSGEGSRSPLVKKKSSQVLKERGSLSVLREGTVDDGGATSSPAKKTPRSTGMVVPLPSTASSPSRYRTSPSDSKITTSPTREKRSRKSSSLSRRSPRMAVPPLPTPPMKIAGSANPVGGSSSDSEDDLSPRLRTHSLRSRTPISTGVNLRSVSSHAEAEALVKLAAKEIIEMGSSTTNKESNGDVPQMSLAEQLARYGETLHLERRFARGEAQRWKSVDDDENGDDAPIDADEESRREAQKAAEEEEERRRKAKERMVWTQRNLDKYAKPEGKDKDKSKDSKEKDKDKQQDADLGYMLHRTTSLEKENGRSNLLPFAKGHGSNGVRRPHTSDSIHSNASGSTVTPPRFGHNATHSSSNIRFTNQPLRVFQRESPRSGSFDYDRPKPSGTMPMAGRRSEDLYRKRYEEVEKEGEERPSPSFGFTVPMSQSPIPSSANVSSAAQSSLNASSTLPDTSAPANSGVDEFGYNAGQSAATSGTGGRPLRQRFGLKSLFGKNK